MWFTTCKWRRHFCFVCEPRISTATVNPAPYRTRSFWRHQRRPTRPTPVSSKKVRKAVSSCWFFMLWKSTPEDASWLTIKVRIEADIFLFRPIRVLAHLQILREKKCKSYAGFHSIQGLRQNLCVALCLMVNLSVPFHLSNHTPIEINELLPCQLNTLSVALPDPAEWWLLTPVSMAGADVHTLSLAMNSAHLGFCLLWPRHFLELHIKVSRRL